MNKIDLMKKHKKPSEIQVGVIGYGGAFNMGRIHLNEMKKAGMTPVAVCELDSERLKAAATDFPGIQMYSSVAAMLKNPGIDLVTIITPHNSHAPLALQCLKAGKSVVCEKPLAITTDECDRMIAEAKKKKLVLSTYHNRHWDGWIMRAVEVVGSGAIGEVYKINAQMGEYQKPLDWWRSSTKISGGTLYDWGVHLLEYCFQIIDDDMTEVAGFAHRGFWAGQTRWKKDTIEDEALAMVRFKKGAWISLNITNADVKPRPWMLEIHGTRGSYSFNFFGWEMSVADGDGAITTTKGKNPPDETWRFYENIAAHMCQGKKLVITPEWSRRPIHAIDLAVKSARTGRALRVRYR